MMSKKRACRVSRPWLGKTWSYDIMVATPRSATRISALSLASSCENDPTLLIEKLSCRRIESRRVASLMTDKIIYRGYNHNHWGCYTRVVEVGSPSHYCLSLNPDPALHQMATLIHNFDNPTTSLTLPVSTSKA